MPAFRNTPVSGALAKVAFALILSAISMVPAANAQTAAPIAEKVFRTGTKQDSAASGKLASYYRSVERQLVSNGYLRADRNPGKLTADGLARDFMAIAMRSEYSLKGGGTARSGRTMPLRRWETPVRIGVQFGPSVSAAQRAADLSEIRRIAARLQRASGHSVQLVDSNPNFHVLILDDQERKNARPLLRSVAPSLSPAAQKAVLGMKPNIFCMVVALPGRSPSDGYRSAVSIVRAEHSKVMRRSCMEEELAQGMGLPNDSNAAWPSIFNDDEEFGVLTRHDELLLKMLYDGRLQSGMSASAADARVKALAKDVLVSG